MVDKQTGDFLELIEKSKTLKRLGSLKKHPGYSVLIEKTNFLPADVSVSQRLWHFNHNEYKIPTCKMCSNNAPWSKEKGGNYRSYCSSKCAHNDPDLINKTKDTCFERYGESTPLKTKEIREKIKQTIRKKYNVENVSQISSVKESKKQTNLKHRGVEYPRQCDSVIEKTRQTNLKKYGNTNVLNSSHGREKTLETNLKKYKVPHPTQSKNVIDKIKQTNLERYGVEHPWKRESKSRKIRNDTMLEKYGSISFPKLDSNVSQKLKEREWLNQQYSELLKSTSQIAGEIGVSPQTISNYLHLHEIPIRRLSHFSSKAIQWLEYVSYTEGIFIQHGNNVGEYNIPNTRYLVDGYCAETNTIYEFHGDAWHGNPKIFEPEEYCHPYDSTLTAKCLLEKTIKREQQIVSFGFNLVVEWENEWDLFIQQKF